MLLKILLLFLVLPFISIIVLKISKLTKIPALLLFIFLGLIFGKTGFVNIFDSEFIQDALGWFTTNISLIVLFFMAGFSIKLSDVKKSGKKVFFQASGPLIFASIVGGSILFLIYGLFGLDFQITYISMLIAASATALVALPLAIPSLMSLKKPTPNHVVPVIISAGSLENVTFLPLILILATIAYGSGNVGLGQAFLIVIIITILVFIIGIVYGKVVGKLFHKVEPNYLLYAIISLVILIPIIYISGPLKSLGIVTALFAGIFLRDSVLNENTQGISGSLSKIYSLYVLPSLFVGVGAKMDWRVFINIKVLLFILVTLLVLGTLKSLIASIIFKNNTEGEKKIVYSTMFLIGSGAINVSVLMGPFFSQIGAAGTTELMAYTGTVLYIVCILISVYVLQKNEDSWAK